MDFGNAALLTFILLGLIAEAKSLVWGTNKERITIGIVNGAAVATVFLVAESAWGNEQIIGGQQLGLLGWSSRLLVAIVLGGGASGLWQGFDTIKNVGQNMPKVYDPKYGTPAVKAPKAEDWPVLPDLPDGVAAADLTSTGYTPAPIPDPPPGYTPSDS